MVPPKNHVELPTLKFLPSAVTNSRLQASRSAEGCCEKPEKLAAPSAPRPRPPSLELEPPCCVRGAMVL